MLDFLIQCDKSLFLFLNGLHCPVLDPVMVFISGKKEWLPLYLLLLVYIIHLFEKKALFVIVFVALLVTLSDQISSSVLKENIHRLRPCHEPSLEGLVHLASNYCGGRYGFVSSHAANVFALASYLTLAIGSLSTHKNFKKWLFGIFIFFWAALVSYSRIYLGVHYPADIIGGALLGLACGWITYKLMDATYNLWLKYNVRRTLKKMQG